MLGRRHESSEARQWGFQVAENRDDEPNEKLHGDDARRRVKNSQEPKGSVGLRSHGTIAFSFCPEMEEAESGKHNEHLHS